MRRAERLYRIVDEMRGRGVLRAADIAAAMEVSARTIYRDIAHLQASGLPIDGEAGVGYMLRPGFDLPSVTFTHDQLEALAVGLSFAERAGDAALASAAREARAKLQASLPNPEARLLVEAPYFTLRQAGRAPPQAAALRRAIRERRLAAMTYVDGAGARSERRVRPLALWALPEGWMFTAWCELRDAFRTFRLDRIAALSLTPEIFPLDEARGLRAFLAADACGTGQMQT
jgi:predicted DNA-binding transcriptional regulator YafY